MRRITRDLSRAEMREMLDPLARGEGVELVFSCGFGAREVTYLVKLTPQADVSKLLDHMDRNVTP